jgi:hypothetical protein
MTRQDQPIQIDERTRRHNPANDQRPPSPPTRRPPAKINPWRVSGLPWPYPLTIADSPALLEMRAKNDALFGITY